MKCPTCGEHSPDDWKRAAFFVQGGGHTGALTLADGAERSVWWMYCANSVCHELMIRIVNDPKTGEQDHTWRLVHPLGTTRDVHISVPTHYRTDYQEAASILALSPRMSAVLSRKILQDVLAEYADLKGFGLAAQIDKFIADRQYPSTLRDNLHHLREIADFSAHTQKDEQAEIINVGEPEAEWTLEIIDRFFDYFIVGPEKDKEIRAAMDKRIAAAQRKPIAPADSDTPG